MAQLKDSIISGNLSVTDDAYIGNARVQHVFDGGTGTVGRDAGSGNSPRYFPSKWIFNENINLVDGTTILIRVPVNGISYGVFLSLDNGTTFVPIVHSNATRLQTQYTEGALVELMYDAEGSVAVYGLDGSDATETITGGVWRLSTCAYINTTYSAMSTAEVTAGTASSARTMQARYLSAGLKAAITKGSNAVPGQFTVYGQVVDTLGATASNNGKFLSIANGSPAWVASPTQDLSAYAPKASPVFTGGITIGSTVLTEAKLQALLSLLAGGLNGTTWLLNTTLTAPSQTITVTNSSGLFYFGGNSYNNTNYTIAVDEYHNSTRLKYYDDFGDSTMYEADQWMDQSCRTITFIADIDTASPSVQAFIDWLNANATRQ